MNYMKDLLCFFRLVDPHDGLISISNLLVITVAIKIMTLKNPSPVDLGALFIAVGNYTMKKKINQGQGAPDDPEGPTPLGPIPSALRAVS
jgi:hypothetical protein